MAREPITTGGVVRSREEGLEGLEGSGWESWRRGWPLTILAALTPESTLSSSKRLLPRSLRSSVTFQGDKMNVLGGEKEGGDDL